MRELRLQAKAAGFQLKHSRRGFFVTAFFQGKPLDPEQFAAMDPQTRAEFQHKQQVLSQAIQAVLQRVAALREEMERDIAQLSKTMVGHSHGLRPTEDGRSSLAPLFSDQAHG